MKIIYYPIIKKISSCESIFVVEVGGVDIGLYAKELNYSVPEDIDLLNAIKIPIDNKKPHTLVARLPPKAKMIGIQIKEGHLSDLNNGLEMEFDKLYSGIVKKTPQYVGTLNNYREVIINPAS